MNALNNASYQSLEDPVEVRRRRLLFRSWNRGTQASDLIFGYFTERSFATLDSIQVDRLEGLLDCSDPDLLDWIYGAVAPPAQHDHDVMRLLRDFCGDRQIMLRPR